MKVIQLLQEEKEPLIIRMMKQRVEKGERVGQYKVGHKWVWLHPEFTTYAKTPDMWIIPSKPDKSKYARIINGQEDKWELVPHATMKKVWVLGRVKDQVTEEVKLPIAIRLALQQMEKGNTVNVTVLRVEGKWRDKQRGELVDAVMHKGNLIVTVKDGDIGSIAVVHPDKFDKLDFKKTGDGRFVLNVVYSLADQMQK